MTKFLVRMVVGASLVGGLLGSDRAAAQSWDRTRRAGICETLLEGVRRAGVAVKNAFDEVRYRAQHQMFLTIEEVYPGFLDWWDEYTTALRISNAIIGTYHDRDARDPKRVAFSVDRWRRQARALGNIFRNEDARASFNRCFLSWEFEFHKERRPSMKNESKVRPPKYLAMKLDDQQITAMIARRFPDFAKRDDLRAVEIAIAPTFLFRAGHRLPRAYDRFTLVVLKDNLVVAEFPTLEGERTVERSPRQSWFWRDRVAPIGVP